MMCYFFAGVAIFFLGKWIVASADLRCMTALYKELQEREAPRSE